MKARNFDGQLLIEAYKTNETCPQCLSTEERYAVITYCYMEFSINELEILK